MNDVIEVNGVKYQRVEDKPKYREVKRPAKVGERIRIVSAFITGGMYRNGDEFTVKRSGDRMVYVPEVACEGNDTGCISDREYVVLEPVEQQPKFSVGDYAKVIRNIHEHKTGHIVKITGEAIAFDYRVDAISTGRTGCINAKNIVPATDEEVRWAEIGRKPGEFKVGDIFSTKYYGPQEVSEVREGEAFPIRYVKADGKETGMMVEGCKLVCPVEKRFDKQ